MKTLQQPNKLTHLKRQEMFAVYQRTKSIQMVKRKCVVNRKTVERYRVKDDWDNRVDKIESLTVKKMDKVVVNRRLRNVQVLDEYINVVRDIIFSQKDNPDIELMDPKVLPKLVTAQEFLLGRGAADDEIPEMSEEAKNALDLLKQLPPHTIAQIAKIISQRISGTVTNGIHNTSSSTGTNGSTTNSTNSNSNQHKNGSNSNSNSNKNPVSAHGSAPRLLPKGTHIPDIYVTDDLDLKTKRKSASSP